MFTFEFSPIDPFDFIFVSNNGQLIAVLHER